MNSKLSIVLLLVVCQLLLISCKHRYSASLATADSLLYTSPKLALHQLDSLSATKDTANTADVMYLSLLKMVAKDKLYMSISNLHSIQRVVDYVEKQGNATHLALAYYLLGRKMSDLHETSQSLAFYHKALEQLETDENMRLKGLTYLQIGYLMQDLDDLERAKEFYAKAFYCDSLVGDRRSMSLSLRDLAVLLMNQNKGKEANILLYKSLLLLPNKGTRILANDIKLQLANNYLYNFSNLDSVWYYLKPSLKGEKTGVTACFIASEYFWEKDDVDKSDKYLSLVLKNGDEYDKQEAYRRKMQIASLKNNMTEAIAYLNSYISYGDSVYARRKLERKQNGLALFDYAVQKERIADLKSQNVRKIWCLLSLGLVVLVLVIVFVFYYQLSIVRKLKLRNKIGEMLISKFSMSSNIENRLLAIRTKITLDEYVDKNKHLPVQAWDELDMEINHLFGGFKDRLYALCTLSEYEYQVCLLMKLGVGTSKIAILTSHSKSSVSMTKQRLFTKMTKEKGKADDFDSFISVL